MPEAPGEGTASPPPSSPLANMIRWVTAFHDVFGLYGRPERYNWDRNDPRSFFFAYPEGPDRTNLFLETDEALLSDFRTANLPTIRANFIDTLKRKLSEPAAEYRDEKSGSAPSPAPRPDGDYRLPPLTFDRPSPNMSSESQPRSLTPITERTDDASRQNSTRTASSAPYERRPSDGASKQGSGSSARNPSGGEEPRLAPITDEGPGQWTEESNQTLSPQDTAPGPAHTPVTQNTLESQTGQTMWSQESADTTDQSGASTPTTTHPYPAPVAKVPVQLAPLDTSPRDKGPDTAATLTARPDAGHSPAVANSREPRLAQPIPVGATMQNPRSATPPQTAVPEVQSPTPRKVSSNEPISPTQAALHNEPAAMYLMNMVDEPVQSPAQAHPTQSQPPATREEKVKSPSDGASGTLSGIGRKPSGARAPPPKKSSTGPRSLSSVDESGRSPLSPPPTSPPISAVANHARDSSSNTQDDLGEDASAYMAYADQPSPDKGKGKEVAPPPIEEEKDEPRSSFALSKTAAERRARADAAAAEQERAMYVPGGGKRTGPARDHTWSDSDEDEDEEDGSPEVQTRKTLPGGAGGQQAKDTDDSSLERSSSRARALPSIPRPAPNGHSDEVRRPSPIDQDPRQRQRPHSRSPQPTMYDQQQHQHQRQSHHYQQQPPPRSHHDAQYRHSQAPPPQQQQQQHQHANRQTVWNANFAAEHGMPEQKTGKFIELEDPSTQLTKAFSPHGLLQAGLQDKEDRSAKRQEELARETGSSLINVPAKPPPPQTGLLGAVAAHERDRKNAGGIGATLTDRERERRQNEDRQREMDKNNRQHMEHMRQYGGGDPYGGQHQYPYGMPPMMMGMPPMGYGNYQGGYNPYAQQQAMMAAQMAYQQAMMSMSQHGGGGSQTGHGTPDRPSSPASMHGQQHLAPPQGGFGGYFPPPPQMSPYGWPGMMPPQWGGGSPAPASPMGGGQWYPPPGGQGDGGHRSRGVSMYSEEGASGGNDRDKSRDRGPVN